VNRCIGGEETFYVPFAVGGLEVKLSDGLLEITMIVWDRRDICRGP
jgi:hypothetical protein